MQKIYVKRIARSFVIKVPREHQRTTAVVCRLASRTSIGLGYIAVVWVVRPVLFHDELEPVGFIIHTDEEKDAAAARSLVALSPVLVKLG